MLAREQFDLLLHQLADQLIGTANPLCLIVYEAAESETLLPSVHKIEEVLKRIGIAVQLTVAQNMFSIPSTSNVQIIRLSQQRTGADVFTIADYPTPEALMMKVLETVVGEGALKELKDSFDGCVPSFSSETCSDRTSSSSFSKLFQRLRLCVATIKRYNNSTIAATAGAYLGVIGFVLWGVLSFTSPKAIRSDLTLPPSQVCLKRSELVDTIQRQLKSHQPNSIPIVTLVGLGGVGKTMVARMVGKQHPGSVVWELNADSLSTLKTSFKELADALARSAEQQTQWRHIQSLPQGEAKDKKTLAFVKAVLQKNPIGY